MIFQVGSWSQKINFPPDIGEISPRPVIFEISRVSVFLFSIASVGEDP
jgi:hypothetical protein